MKNKQSKSRKLPIILTIIGLVLVAGVMSGFVFQDKLKIAVADAKTTIANSGKPKFIFDTAKFPDWASTGNTWHDTDTIAVISVSQCTDGSNCSDFVEDCRAHIDKSNQSCQKLEQYTADGCMVSAYYLSGSIAPDTAMKSELKKWSGFGNTPEKVGVNSLSMRTPEGDKSYQFYQYDTNNTQGGYKRGSAFGFIPLSSGYIEVRSVCREASQLDDTLPLLNAIRLEA